MLSTLFVILALAVAVLVSDSTLDGPLGHHSV